MLRKIGEGKSFYLVGRKEEILRVGRKINAGNLNRAETSNLPFLMLSVGWDDPHIYVTPEVILPEIAKLTSLEAEGIMGKVRGITPYLAFLRGRLCWTMFDNLPFRKYEKWRRLKEASFKKEEEVA